MSSPGPSVPPSAGSPFLDHEQIQHSPIMDDGLGIPPREGIKARAAVGNSDSPADRGTAGSNSPENLIDLTELAPADTQTTTEASPKAEETPKSQDVLSGEPPDIMTSSVVTVKPDPQRAVSSRAADGLLDVKPAGTYVDPTPPTPTSSQPTSRAPSAGSRYGHSRSTSEVSPTRSDAAYDERRYLTEDEPEGGSRSEIQSIMAQFSGDGGGPGEEEVMSPRLEITSPHLGGPSQHPPRKSSLEPLSSGFVTQFQEFRVSNESRAAGPSSSRRISIDSGPPVPPKDAPPTPAADRGPGHHPRDGEDVPTSPSLSSLHRPPPPEPEPEPVLQFDFHRFLEQLRNKKADPVARYLKSFLQEFGKKQWMVHEQVKIVGDFLAFISNKMAQCEVWRTVSDPEFDNAREGMEKLVMNRLYTQTFSPAIPPPQPPIPGAKPKRRGGERAAGPGRRGQHQEDVERDEILTQKINIYAWVRERHLDIPPIGDSGRRFLKLAQQELLKIKSYRAPRDKIICVLNCCKVIFGLLKNAKSDTSADSFMPLLIYVALQANPEHLVSNVQYILRFRNQDKLAGEAGYYLSSLMGAIQFIENMDRTTLTITDDEFEKNVEAAVSAIAEKHRPKSPAAEPGPQTEKPAADTLQPPGDPSTPRRSTPSEGGTDSEDQAAITGILRTIQKPLTTIGRIFSDETPPPPPPGPADTPRTPARLSADLPPRRTPARLSADLPPPPPHAIQAAPEQRAGDHGAISAEEAAARQASAETAEAQRLERAEHTNVVETLSGMFPDLDREVISDVVYQKQGRVGLAVDACLALSS